MKKIRLLKKYYEVGVGSILEVNLEGAWYEIGKDEFRLMPTDTLRRWLEDGNAKYVKGTP